MKPTPANATGYSVTQISLHWLIAALVLFQILFGESMDAAMDAAEEGEAISAGDLWLSGAHYWVGIGILALVAMRLALRVASPAPAARPTTPIEWAASTMHSLFYALLFLVPISGLLAVYVNDEIGDIHKLAKPVFIALIAVHAAAALYHQFVVRDGTLRRMLVPNR
jgi:cytochrome b561